jgi:hypothetical protein
MTSELEQPMISGKKMDKEKIISRELIELGLKRGAAFLMPPLYPGIDLLIPVCLEGKYN